MNESETLKYQDHAEPSAPEFWGEILSGHDNTFIYTQKNELETGRQTNARLEWKLNPLAYDSILELTKGADTGIFNCVMAATILVLSRYAQRNSLVIDTPLFNAQDRSTTAEDTVPVLFQIREEEPIRAYLNRLQDTIGKTYLHQYDLKGKQNTTQTNVLVSYSGIFNTPADISAYDLYIDIKKNDTSLHLSIDYKVAHFDKAFVQRFQHHLDKVITYYNELNTCIQQVDILTAEEYLQLKAFNTSTFPEAQIADSVISQFERQAIETPEAIAVVMENQSLSYEALNQESGKLARYLLEHCHVEKGDVIGIMVDRSPRFIIGLLGIMKSGCAYLPIDPRYPKERKQFMLEESGAKALLTDSDSLFDIDFFNGELFALDIQLDMLDTPLERSIFLNGDDLAYVIFTSGSTGQPKGVMIRHSALLNLCHWHQQAFRVDTNSKATLFSTIAFDASVWEIWPYLLAGACLYPLNDEMKLDLTAIVKFFNDKGITHTFLPTPICSELNNQEVTVSEQLLILTGGDELQLGKETSLNIVNNYGPSEAAVVATSIALKENKHTPVIPIGKPIDNVEVLILDEQLRRVPVGVEGELYISGVSLALGYINRDELTTEKFLPHPFQKDTLMYKSGDLGCWTDDGNVLFKGRNDQQVKIRGNRIELGEIRARMLQYDEVQDAIALFDKDHKRILAYYVANEAVSEESLHNFLMKRLPDYMIPSVSTRLNEFPLTANGKIDSKVLLKWAVNHEQSQVTEILSADEDKMISVWKEVLGVEQVALEQAFFALGGDSIKAIRLIYDVNNAFRVDLKLMDVFKYDTPVKLLARMNELSVLPTDTAILDDVQQFIAAGKEEYLQQTSNKELIEDVYPVADIQLGMLYHGTHSATKAMYHDQIVHQVKYAGFDEKRMRRTLELMADEHEILRTSFDLGYEPPVQLVHKSIAIDYVHTNLTGKHTDEQKKAVDNWLVEDREQPFDHHKPGLWRVRTFTLNNDRVVVALVCHHAIIDGWSDATFSTELNNIYHTLDKQPDYIPQKPGCSYRNYVVDELVAKRDPAVKAFWQSEFEHYEKIRFMFPLDDQGSVTKVFNAPFDSTLKNGLVTFASEHNTSPRVVCLAAYLRVIKTISFNDTSIIGLHTHNRPLHSDSDRMLGCFLNSVPFQYQFPEGLNWMDHLQAVNDKVVKLGAYNHLSLMEIARIHAKKGGAQNENPFFDTLFGYLDFHVYQDLITAGEGFSETFEQQEIEANGQGINNTFLNFIVNATLNEFNLLIFYKSTQVDEKLLSYLAELFQDALEKIMAQSEEVIDFGAERFNVKKIKKTNASIDFDL
ncbi:amino acid adenylation domain-containing protein [Fulvivirga sp. M361]|uniref:non-ribosomal peptide synthetase n=1 Tax=Fulvivirga sp. M361 TaxID=2594266 RepID=UPI00117BC246|nr:non-ribosomal peptide synthetase [Fulvivirga sp. M361]TRX53350.1 amino acid adenylation domain-containing protein [Fulvivirga sp. M361]